MNTPEPVLREMYWYDIILMLNEYNNMIEENEKNNPYKEDLNNQQMDINSKFSNMKMPNMPNINSITSGLKLPNLK